MVFSKFRALFPTIIFILVCVLISIVMLNFFQVDMNDNNGFKVLNRVLTVEGMKNGKKINGSKAIIKEGMCSGKHKKEGMCGSKKHKEGMCGSMEGMCGLEGMKNKKYDDDDDNSEYDDDDEYADQEETDEEEDEQKDLETLGAFASNLMK